jgi:hypothetical protein
MSFKGTMRRYEILTNVLLKGMVRRYEITCVDIKISIKNRDKFDIRNSANGRNH